MQVFISSSFPIINADYNNADQIILHVYKIVAVRQCDIFLIYCRPGNFPVFEFSRISDSRTFHEA